MSERYFSPEEVERLIPRLARIMEGVMRAHREATEARERLRAEQQRIALSGGGVLDRAAWKADAERLRRGADKVKEGVSEIGRLGGAVKDLGLGLVDFPHRRQGRPVNLCWKCGEEAVRWWHGLDEGYAGRKPL